MGKNKKLFLKLRTKTCFKMAAKFGATFGVIFVCSFLAISLQIVSSGTVEKRDAGEEIEDYFENTWNSILGGKCLLDDQCSAISYCDTDDILNPECKLRWWFMLVLAVIALMLIGSIISCLCCPCCCLYNLGK